MCAEPLEAGGPRSSAPARQKCSPDRCGYRGGYYSRGLITRIGKLEPRVPGDYDERFSAELLERCLRWEKALVSALAEMSVQGVSTRKVRAITEEPCGHAFSASTIGQIDKGLDEALFLSAARWRSRTGTWCSMRATRRCVSTA